MKSKRNSQVSIIYSTDDLISVYILAKSEK